jgi:glycerol-3-phosphate acyltransferase PlsY
MTTIVLFVLAYLLGSIPSGVWLGKIFFHKDIRDYGSHSSGTTNTMRVLGKKAGVIVFILDVLKGVIATVLPVLFHLNINPLWFGVVAVIGHTLPIFAHFKGGKAVATSAGMLLGYNPLFFCYCLLFFFIFLYFSSMVSLSSILVAIFTVISTIVLPEIWPFIIPHHDWFFTLICTIVACYIVYRHRENIVRIKNGTESRVNFGLRKSKK